MAYGFGSTYGTGTSDLITTSFTGIPRARTYAFWSFQHGTGGSTYGRQWHQDAAFTPYSNDTTGTFNFEIVEWGEGRWQFVNQAYDTWLHWLITYDSNISTNAPVVYINGVDAGATLNVSPGSTYTAPTANFCLGNDPTLVANWDGMLAEFAIWDHIMSAPEITALSKGFAPAFFPNGRVMYYPLLRDLVDRHNAAPTITGTPIVQPHVPIIYPAARRRVVAPFTAATPPPMASLIQQRTYRASVR